VMSRAASTATRRAGTPRSMNDRWDR
jgi:hypothetical protein